ncbi:toll/interleukin-1 receptor domain-containing protein [Bacteroides mediterraneensis]|uniref:toll/interleukin-1 receptor domain-containing protein n=1 Tax=Bacteroides mediterraneensis TaxID=1841856 RepID=UPI0009339F84|nr:toll/interleukin-1 receptor domain-containing protein [Bacteroides mediterraneensis]
MIKPDTKIEPLREDLRCIIEDSFLLSISFKRWIISVKLDKMWEQCLSKAKQENRFFGIGSDEYEAGNALTLLLNISFEEGNETLVWLVSELLYLYHNETRKNIDVSALRLDMQVIGIDNTLMQQLDDLCVSEAVTEEVKPVVLTKEQKVRQLENDYKEVSKGDRNSRKSIEAYLEWHKEALIYLSDFYTDMNSDFKEFKNLDNSGNGYSLYSNFNKIYTKYNLLMSKVNMESENNQKKGNSPMVFISHSSKDKEFAEALVDLLESIGLNKETLFCSSVDGYGLGLSDDIFETLRGLFENHDLFMIFLHSPRYYKSSVSLNEMGAAWVLRSGFCSILTSDMDFSGLTGVVNGSKISIKVNAQDAASRLNDLYKILQEIFNLAPLEITQWERKRSIFLRNVNAIKYTE